MFICDKCGKLFTIDGCGIARHAGADGIDYDADADHVPYGQCVSAEADKDPAYVAEEPPEVMETLCGRCYDFVDEVFPAPCAENPEALAGTPLGQYHCPDCGAMVVAGLPHPRVCRLCLERRAPGIDVPIPGLDVPLHP